MVISKKTFLTKPITTEPFVPDHTLVDKMNIIELPGAKLKDTAVLIALNAAMTHMDIDIKNNVILNQSVQIFVHKPTIRSILKEELLDLCILIRIEYIKYLREIQGLSHTYNLNQEKLSNNIYVEVLNFQHKYNLENKKYSLYMGIK